MLKEFNRERRWLLQKENIFSLEGLVSIAEEVQITGVSYFHSPAPFNRELQRSPLLAVCLVCYPGGGEDGASQVATPAPGGSDYSPKERNIYKQNVVWGPEEAVVHNPEKWVSGFFPFDLGGKNLRQLGTKLS